MRFFACLKNFATLNDIQIFNFKINFKTLFIIVTRSISYVGNSSTGGHLSTLMFSVLQSLCTEYKMF